MNKEMRSLPFGRRLFFFYEEDMHDEVTILTAVTFSFGT